MTASLLLADVDPDEDVDALSPEKSATRAEYFKKLKGKIGVWYNSKYGGSVEKPQAKVTFKALFDKPELEPPKAVKPRILHYYSHRFYHERVKTWVSTEWAKVSGQADPPKEITVRNRVTAECWAAELDSFKAEVIEQLEKDHTAAVEAYTVATSGDAPKTLAEYNTALHNAGYYLQPFVDAIFERFGMNISLLLCGPIPDRGGRIEIRSIHAGMTNGLRSFVQFSHQCFTETECQERSLGVEAEGSDHEAAAAVTMPVSSPPDASQGESNWGDGNLGFNEEGLDNDLSLAPPSAWWMSMGQKKDPLPDREREMEMQSLREMSEADVEGACQMARNRLFFARVGRGVDATLADAMSSDPEESDPEEQPEPVKGAAATSGNGDTAGDGVSGDAAPRTAETVHFLYD
ncbi:hypothetical protein B0H14DRAFT_3456932 [Mycena olivaceomarginata]|nr:hypothetical protein B0H14DRAFT_3456932 [Mycena olivaceomarginata]